MTDVVVVVKVEEGLKCELLTSDSANSLKSCLEHERPGYQQQQQKKKVTQVQPSAPNQTKGDEEKVP